MVIIQFPGDGYLGDCMRLDTLSVDPQLDFGIECYHVPQS
jgi:hypothetical protein